MTQLKQAAMPITSTNWNRLSFAYEAAAREADLSAKEQTCFFDLHVQNSVLEEGDRVLVRNVGVQGKQKLKDIWENHPYVIKWKIAPDISVYEVQMKVLKRGQGRYIGTYYFRSVEYPILKTQSSHHQNVDQPKWIQFLRAAKSLCPAATRVTKKEETIERNSHKQFLSMWYHTIVRSGERPTARIPMTLHTERQDDPCVEAHVNGTRQKGSR